MFRLSSPSVDTHSNIGPQLQSLGFLSLFSRFSVRSTFISHTPHPILFQHPPHLFNITSIIAFPPICRSTHGIMSEPTIAHAPSFRGRGRGRGRSQAIRAHVARLAQARKAANGRRGRQKLYDHPKPQAASERLKELKAAYSTVANAIRPALEDLADRSLEVLNKGQADAYRAFKEYEEVKSFLDKRIRDVQSIHNNRLLLDTQLSEFMFRETRKITEESFIVRKIALLVFRRTFH